jgi:5-hydroxyisourate hydrolase
MPGLSIHAFDVARGVPAAGLRVEVRSESGEPAQFAGVVGADGHVALDAPWRSELPVGRYQVAFDVAAFYGDAGVPLPAVPFQGHVVFAFGIGDPAQHYHLPFKFTPWGFTLFRGGA